MKQHKKALVCGAGGFIGNHLVTRLKQENYYIVGVDLKLPEFSSTEADKFIQGDLRNQELCKDLFAKNKFNEVYQLAADMGGAGYIFTGDNDANVMHNSAQINLNIAMYASQQKNITVFYSSSACMYPEHNQLDPNNPKCSESSAYPAAPDSEYGWEKLFSERIYLAFNRNYNLDIRIARFHNIFGPLGTWTGGKEKAPAAICRKTAIAESNGAIEIWGNGKQTRSFLYIDECIEGIRKLMQSNFIGPVNIGSDEMVTINELTEMVIEISGKQLSIKHIDGPLGVMGRNSDNNLIKEKLGWAPNYSLKQGLLHTYKWIEKQL